MVFSRAYFLEFGIFSWGRATYFLDKLFFENEQDLSFLKALNQVNIYNKIEQLETNHIYHLQKEVKRLNYVLWTVGFMVASQFIAMLLKVFQ